ncbi:MAG TPA: phospholipase domain-containing protein, partial [Sphingobacteriaceae bacterium]
DENDGYFDHVPPFVPPVPNDSLSGKASAGIDLNTEYVSLEEDLKRKPASHARGGPIGLGYRVPLVIASPWSRGGAVCSQVFDHTSILMFLEKFLTHKTGREIKETNNSAWRRTICGDLTSTFTQYNGEKYELPKSVEHDSFVKSIHKAQFKGLPAGFHALSATEIQLANASPSSSVLPRQEKGTRPSRALPYELYANGKVTSGNKFEIRFEAGTAGFGTASLGAPFHVYSYGPAFTNRAYAVAAGDSLTDTWNDLGGQYHFRVHGPNGFFREFKGHTNETTLEITCSYEKGGKKNFTGNVELTIINRSAASVTFVVADKSYSQKSTTRKIEAGAKVTVPVDTSKSLGWYDTSVTIVGSAMFEHRFAGRVETGKEGVSDPAMG